MPQTISDLLLSTSALVALCDNTHSEYQLVADCVARCKLAGHLVWIYAGCLPTAAQSLSSDQLDALTSIVSRSSVLSALGADFRKTEGYALDGAMQNALDRLHPESRLLTVALDPPSVRAIAAKDYCELQIPQRAVEFVDLIAQQNEIRDELEVRIDKNIKSGKFILGPEIAELEESLAQYTGARNSICVASGTEALLIALMALEIGPGDEVITSPFSFVATAEVIALLGATPVFVDIDPITYNITADNIAAAITDHTKAIMPVSLFGQAADFDSINRVALDANLPVIEDAAQSFGAKYHDRMSCHLSTIGCTSFFPSKPLGGYGDGGAIFTDDAVLAERMRHIHVHGQSRRYHSTCVGVGGRLDTLQAAILLAKLRAFPNEIIQRGIVATQYAELLSEVPDLVLPTTARGNSHVFAQYTVEVKDRDGVAARMAADRIPTAVHYPSMIYSQPAYSRFAPSRALAHAEYAAAHVLSLPFHPRLAAHDQARVASSLRRAIDDKKIAKAA